MGAWSDGWDADIVRHPIEGCPDVQFQAIFSTRDRTALYLDGILHDDGGHGTPRTIVSARTTGRVLDAVMAATLDEWADDMALLDVVDDGRQLVLRAGDTRITLHPVDAPAG